MGQQLSQRVLKRQHPWAQRPAWRLVGQVPASTDGGHNTALSFPGRDMLNNKATHFCTSQNDSRHLCWGECFLPQAQAILPKLQANCSSRRNTFSQPPSQGPRCFLRELRPGGGGPARGALNEVEQRPVKTAAFSTSPSSASQGLASSSSGALLSQCKYLPCRRRTLKKGDALALAERARRPGRRASP